MQQRKNKLKVPNTLFDKGLTSNNLDMIKAIAQNDLHSARRTALASLAEDRSKKNSWAIDRYRKYLTANASVIANNIPNNLKPFLARETPNSFHPEQYYLRDQERSIYENVRRMKLTAVLRPVAGYLHMAGEHPGGHRG